MASGRLERSSTERLSAPHRPLAMFSSTQTFGAGTSLAGPTQEAGARRARQEEKQTCLPLTVRCIERAAEQRADAGGELRFHGSEPGVLLLVGMVESLTRQAASIEFTLNDATGRIKTRLYLSDRQSSDLDNLAPGCYVSAFGGVRTAPEIHFAAMGLRIVESADEVSYHMIEAVHAAVRLRRGAPADPMTPAPKRPAPVEAAAAEELSPPKGAAPGAVPAAAAAATTAAPGERLAGSTLRKAVYRFVQQAGEGRPEGVSFVAVCNHVDPTPADEVTGALQKLVDAGEIFTTIDDGHFLCL
mmetsp:Transcript_146945/g.409313  ORF Transcript_146945/g.409313 Transcript_146945/m.409313 type:complete len:301 (+) Transcript_146945:3-905(+)